MGSESAVYGSTSGSMFAGCKDGEQRKGEAPWKSGLLLLLLLLVLEPLLCDSQWI